MLNKEQLDVIKERVAKATPGEWIGDYGGVETTHKDFQKVSGGVYGEHNTICNTFDGEYIENSNAIHDSRFIAHARQDVPVLIAEVERLRERVALDFFRCGETTTAFAESVEENKRLREALKLIQNSDTWLIEPSPMMHTIEEAYHACVGIADKALGDDDE